MTHKSYKPMFETLEQELLELDSMTIDTIKKFYGTGSFEEAQKIVIRDWRCEYSDQEIEDAIRFVEESKDENYY